MTGTAVKVLSMELVPPNKVHREEAKPGDGVSIITEVSPLDHLFQQKCSFSIGPLTYKHVWKFTNLSKLSQNH